MLLLKLTRLHAKGNYLAKVRPLADGSVKRLYEIDRVRRHYCIDFNAIKLPSLMLVFSYTNGTVKGRILIRISKPGITEVSIKTSGRKRCKGKSIMNEYDHNADANGDWLTGQ